MPYDMSAESLAVSPGYRAEARDRQLYAELLDHLAAGGGLPYPFADTLYLLDVTQSYAVRTAPAPGDDRLARLARFLTSAVRRHPMEPRSGEGSGSDGRSRVTELPVR